MAAVDIVDNDDDVYDDCLTVTNPAASLGPVRYENIHVGPVHVPSPMNSLAISDIVDYEMADDDSITLPELTEHHILTVFMGCGITYGQVNTLGLLLGLSRDRLLSGGPEPINHTYRFAVETVIKWLKKEPQLSLKEKHEKLADKLRQLELNYLIPRLRGQERYTAVDPGKIIDFLAKETKNFTKDQAYEFGRCLKLTRNKIDEIVQQSGVTRGMDIVIQIFECVDRENTIFQDPLVEVVVSGLNSAAECQGFPEDFGVSTDRSYSRSRLQNFSTETSATTQGELLPLAERSPMTAENVTSEPSRKMKGPRKLKYCWIAGGVIAVFFLVLSVVTVVFLSFLPPLPSLPQKPIIPSDVVVYEISNSYWLTSISLELEGPLGCYGEALSVKCNDIQYCDESVTDYSDRFNYLYFEEQSTVLFTLNETFDSDFCPPYYAWIFTSYESAEDHSDNNFKSMACGHPPEDVWCIDVTEMEQFIAPVSSYYFIRCDRGLDCSFIDTILVNSSKYDFESTKSLQIASVDIRTQDITGKELLLAMEDEVCMMLQLNKTNCGGSPPIYQIKFAGKTRRYDLLIYSSLLSIIVPVVIFEVLCGITILRYCIQKLH